MAVVMVPAAGRGQGGASARDPRSLPRGITDRDRFLVFALTAAELLLEVSADGVIRYAAGAFASRFGREPEAWIGRSVLDLVAPAARPALMEALAVLAARDRLPPTALRLADGAGTPVAVAGLSLDALAPAAPGHAGRLCLTFSALPGSALPVPVAAAPEATATGEAALPDPESLRRAMEASLRRAPDAATAGQLALVELQGPDGPLAPRPDLAGKIAAALSAAVAGGGLAGELSAGRYGVLSGTAGDFARIAGEIEALARASGLGQAVATGTTLALDQAGLSPLQATRALRHALGTFARGGPAALRQAGFAGGLAGFVADACDRAAGLRRVIEERRFRMAFQPIVALADRSLHHYEALLRPQPGASPRPGSADAQDFVTFAETVGLSEELDWAVVVTCAEAAAKADGARIACNLSGLSLQSAEFRDRLLNLLRAQPQLVPRLLIEVTETAEIEDEAEAVRTVDALRALRLPVCIDDFGAGTAAFRTLRAFRVDYVKIDGHYVQAALRSARDRGFIAAMVDLAHNVGAEVVAERIETEAEAAAMQELGVAYGQGWLFGKPGRLPGSL